jgi:hypothetical protein
LVRDDELDYPHWPSSHLRGRPRDGGHRERVQIIHVNGRTRLLFDHVFEVHERVSHTISYAPPTENCIEYRGKKTAINWVSDRATQACYSAASFESKVDPPSGRVQRFKREERVRDEPRYL